jgi:hypothetical protein
LKRSMGKIKGRITLLIALKNLRILESMGIYYCSMIRTFYDVLLR